MARGSSAPITTRAGGDEHDVRARDRCRRRRRERQPAQRAVSPHQLLETGLVDRDLAAHECFDAPRVDIDARDSVTELGEPRSRDEPDIASSNDDDLHPCSCAGLARCACKHEAPVREIMVGRELGVVRGRCARVERARLTRAAHTALSGTTASSQVSSRLQATGRGLAYHRVRRMRVLSKCLIALSVAWGTRAHAQEPGAPAWPPGASDASELTDEELARIAEGEAIEIFDERPDKPFDRDTEVRLSGEELAARGAVDLATALDLLPDVTVRDAGRGGFNVDIRGARKGAVSVLVDGVLVSDPYYGTFDVSTIPITDIVQVRMSTSPQSPIDGPGGPGGVIEVVTRDAIGGQLVIARATSDTLPSFGVAGMARVPLARRLALRVSASGIAGARDFAVRSGSLDENRHAATGAARLEYRSARERVVVDGFLDDRHYVSPPSETSSILLIDRETSARVTTKADVQRGKLQLQGQAFVQHLHRLSRNFMDAALTVEQRAEDLRALRVGGIALATHPIGKDARWVTSASFSRDSGDVTTTMSERVRGEVAIVEAATDLQYEKRTLRFDGAAGVAVPFGVGADAWPEAKVVAKWRPAYGPFEIVATGARKGRVPSLRERFDASFGGNDALAPEHATHAELRTVGEIKEQFRVEIAPFFRRTTGTIRRSTVPADMGKLVNLDELDTRGVDVSGRVHVHRMVEVGAAYDYIKVTGCANPPCLDRLPEHRAEGWIEVRPEPRVTVHARARYFGKFVDQTMALPAYTTVEATATATLSRKYLLVLRGDDLLNARPETHAGYFGPGLVVSLVLQGRWE
jgi:outer membrane receptor protein involved in Fe transport